MFRKGGGANMNGIMSGIEDRQNFENGTPSRVEELAAANLKTLGGDQPDKGFDPLTTFLLQYGPQVAGQTGGGNLIGNLLLAAEKPVQNIIENQAERRRYMRDLKAGATELAIKKAQKSHLKEIVILLSPSAASFDQFINFEDRGNKFKEIVNKQLKEGVLIC